MSTEYDVVLVHDCTGSQGPYIEAVRRNSIDMANSLQRSLKGTAQFRVVAFRDHKEQGDAWFVRENPFTPDPITLRAQLNKLEASGGGDGPEAQIDALDAALNSRWRPGAKKIVWLITDSPPHGINEPGDRVPASHPRFLTAEGIRKDYRNAGIHFSMVACVPEISRYRTAVNWYKDFVRETMGKYFEVGLDGKVHQVDLLKRAIVGSVLYSADSARITDKWADWIRDESHRGHHAIVDDLHSKLAAEGEECHDVYCTNHGTHDADIQYELGPVSRTTVDAIVGRTLRLKELDASDEMANAMLDM